MNEQLLSIAQRMGFATLDTRNSDDLDFREVAVWQIKAALEAAFAAGQVASLVIAVADQMSSPTTP